MKFYDCHGKEHELPAGKTWEWRPSAYAFVMHDKKLLLVKDATHGKWELPGGGIEPQESILEGAVREVFEETGYNIRITDKRPIYAEDGSFYFNSIDKYFRTIRLVYFGELENKIQITSHIDFEHEIKEIKWHTLEAIKPEETDSMLARVLNSYQPYLSSFHTSP